MTVENSQRLADLSPEQITKLLEYVDELEPREISDLTFMDLYDKIRELLGDYPWITPLALTLTQGVLCYAIWKAYSNPDDLRIRTLLMTRVITFNSMLLGAYILQNAESEAAETTAIVMMGLPILGGAIEEILNFNKQSRKQQTIAVCSVFAILLGATGWIGGYQAMEYSQAIRDGLGLFMETFVLMGYISSSELGAWINSWFGDFEWPSWWPSWIQW